MKGNTVLIGQSVTKPSASKIEIAVVCNSGESSDDVLSPAVNVTVNGTPIKVQDIRKTSGFNRALMWLAGPNNFVKHLSLHRKMNLLHKGST